MFGFFAYLNRMKYIRRWSLMRSNMDENIMEHSQQVAVIAHALALIGNKYYGKSYNADKIAVIAQFHEAGEVITGDLPTPIKYYNVELNHAYKDLEKIAEERLLNMLPKELASEYREYIKPDERSDEYKIVKAADKIAAYVKCVEELKGGNAEFKKAKSSIKTEIEKYDLEEVSYFMTNFLPAFEKTLDEIDI